MQKLFIGNIIYFSPHLVRLYPELSRLFRAYGEGTALESIALKAAMIAPSLLLQKPHRTSKSKDRVECLQRRLEMWRLGDINGLILEGQVLNIVYRGHVSKQLPILTKLLVSSPNSCFRGRLKQHFSCCVMSQFPKVACCP